MGKKLWILNHYAVSPDLPGGTRHFDLSRELVKRGHEVTIFASGFDHKIRKYTKVDRNKLFRTEVYDGVRFVWINTFPYYKNDWRRVVNMLSYSWRVLSCTKGLEKPDAIIGSCVHPFAALSGWWLSRKYKAKFFFEERDLWPQTLVDVGALRENSSIAKVLYALESFLYRRAEKVIFPMLGGVEYAIGRGVSRDKVVWLPQGVDLERFNNPKPLRADSDIAICFHEYKDKFKVIYTGAHGPANDLESLVSCASMLRDSYPDIHFFLIGDGPEKAHLIEEAKQMALNNISFLDAVSKNEIPGVLANADLLVHTLKRMEVLRFGISANKMFDYMASAKPIITAIGASNNPIVEAKCGVDVEPEDPEALAKAIIQIYEMPEEKRRELGLNGRRYVEKYHDIRMLADQLETILGWKSDTRSFVSGEAKESALG